MLLAIESTEVAQEHKNGRAAEEPARGEGLAFDGEDIEVKVDPHYRHLARGDVVVGFVGTRSRNTTLTHRWQVMAGQSGLSQKAHVSISVRHLEHFLAVVVCILISPRLLLEPHRSARATRRAGRPTS
jgi:hypothetical protein